MRWLSGVTSRLESLLRRRAAEARTDEEFEFHIAMQTEKNMARGMLPEEARRRALLEFGGVDRHREAMRDTRRPRLLSELRQDLGFTMRSLRAAPAFTFTALLVIALGVGATTALFSLANALLFRPLPVAAPGELYMLQEVRTAGTTSTGPEGRRIPYARYEAYRDATGELLGDLAAHTFRAFALRTDAGAQSIAGSATSGNYFEVLGLTPAVGRFYTRDDEPGAVLSHRFWRSHFNEDADVLGRLIYVDGIPYTVLGVAPRRFDGTVTGFTMSVWLPFRAYGESNPGSTDQWVGMFTRMADRAAAERAAAPLTAIASQLPAENASVTIERAYLAPLTGLPENARGGVLGFMGMLLAAGFLVLLIAAANIAALLLARAFVRQREFAVRLAVGAGRARLVRQLLTESTALFLAGGLGGIGLAYAATALLARIRLPGLPIVVEAAPDLRLLAFGLGIAVATGFAFGLAPALRATRPDLADALRDGAASGGTVRARGRSIFVAAQLAFATVLLITAGLFVRGLQHGLAQDPGFRTEGIVVGSIDLAPWGMDEEARGAFRAELMRRVRALPGVESAAMASTVLMTGGSSSTIMGTTAAEPVTLTAYTSSVDEQYFPTMDIQLVRGRAFTAADDAAATRVAIVNETLAERLWPGEEPIGQQLRQGASGPVYEVVGVTRNGLYVDLSEEPRPFVFFAAAQSYSSQSAALHVRGRGNAAALILAIRRELSMLHPDVALETAMPLTTMIGFSLIPQRFAAALIGLFGVLGLVLAGAGVYGVMSYQIAQRRREFGIRLTLGASARDVVHLVVGRGALVAAGGTLAGIALAAAVTHLLASLLFGLSPLDPVTFGGVAITLAVVAILASWVPARRALRVDPAVSLRPD
jgi:predicted permease